MGDRTSTIAFPLLILALTGSPVQAGLLGLVGSLPYVFLSLPAGALVDRWNRKAVMIVCDTGRALALASIPIAAALGHLPAGLLYAVALVEGTLFVFFDLSQVAGSTPGGREGEHHRRQRPEQPDLHHLVSHRPTAGRGALRERESRRAISWSMRSRMPDR